MALVLKVVSFIAGQLLVDVFEFRILTAFPANPCTLFLNPIYFHLDVY